MGYQRAGFYVVGIDNEPQPHYCGDEFHRMDAFDFLWQLASGLWPEPFLIHTSPPCQKYSVTAPLSSGNHPDLIGPVRKALQITGRPYVIENVPGAPLINPLMLCGTMFPELRVIRHRLFETNPVIHFPPASCNHWGKRAGSRLCVNDRRVQQSFEHVDLLCCVGNDFVAADGRQAMDIDWMTRKELSQAIPPAYTEWLGKKMLELLEGEITQATRSE